MADRPSYVYVTYIESSPEHVWGGSDRPGPDRPELGAQQRLRLAGRLVLGTPAP
jgi:hypothetical protein